MDLDFRAILHTGCAAMVKKKGGDGDGNSKTKELISETRNFANINAFISIPCSRLSNDCVTEAKHRKVS